ncbi:hypothetical protein RJ035_001343 [Blastomyces gilchristii]
MEAPQAAVTLEEQMDWKEIMRLLKEYHKETMGGFKIEISSDAETEKTTGGLKMDQNLLPNALLNVSESLGPQMVNDPQQLLKIKGQSSRISRGLSAR